MRPEEARSRLHEEFFSAKIAREIRLINLGELPMRPNILADLDPSFRKTVEKVIAKCKGKGHVMRPISGIRSPWEQARLWRQSRSREEIAALVSTMKAQGAPWLAKQLDRVGPTYGRHVTNAPPGKSVHQYRLAVDCVWVKDGKAEWEDMTAYRIYAAFAVAEGLTAGLNWGSFPDPPHIQHASMDSLGRKAWPWIEAEMERLWGNTPSGQFGRPSGE
jgi:hypothetical protein